VQCPECRSPYWDRERGNGDRVSASESTETPVGHGKRLVDEMVESGILSRGSRDVQQRREDVSARNQTEAPELTDKHTAAKICRNPDCGKELKERNGFWYCADITCGTGGQQQGRV
jgi:hypothetical protein